MISEKEENVWTLQQFARVAGQPWFALQLQTDQGVEVQFTGYRGEMDDLIVKLGITAEELPTITEEEFFARCEWVEM